MKKGNLIFTGIFSLLAVLVIFVSSSYPKGQDGIPGPGFFPILIAILMLLGCASLLITSLKMDEQEDISLELSSKDNRRVYLTMAILVAYVAVMPVVGFCLTSFLFLSGMIRWFGKYSMGKCCMISAVIVALIYGIFGMVLHVSLRFGLLF